MSDKPLENESGILSTEATTGRWAVQQTSAAPVLMEAIVPLRAEDIVLTGGESSWTPTGCKVSKGQHFSVSATGANILDRTHAVFVQPKFTLWVRIGKKGPIRKIIFEDETVFEAWADDEVEVFTLGMSVWADDNGNILPGPRTASEGGIGVSVRHTSAPITTVAPPPHWTFMSMFGEVTIFSGDGIDISVDTRDGDVSIIQTPVDIPLNDHTALSWEWLIEKLPSELPENLVFTHDYISVAVQFDNGLDLTYLWSKELPVGYHFGCPLPWWCDRETHWVVESGTDKLGQWQSETRQILPDYRVAIGGKVPDKIVSVWIIANSVFQRIGGKARFRNIRLFEDASNKSVLAGSGMMCYSVT